MKGHSLFKLNNYLEQKKGNTMKKIFFLLLLFAFAKSFCQIQLSGSITSLEWNNSTNQASSAGDTYLGHLTNSPYYYFVLCVFDLDQLGGIVTSVNSGQVTLSMDQTWGYTGDGYTAGFITSDVSEASMASQVSAIQGMSGTWAHEQNTITLTIALNKIVNNKIIIGVRRSGDRKRLADCSANISATVVAQATLHVSYSQGSGNIVAYAGSAYNTPSAPATLTANEGTQITISPLSPTITNYTLTYNENQAPLNKSQWTKYDGNGASQGNLTPATNSFSLSKSEDGWDYKAEMKKLCTVTVGMENYSGSMSGTLQVDGSNVSVPATPQKVEGNNISSAVTSTYIAGASGTHLNYNFSNWKVNGTDNTTSTSITLGINAHTTLNAYYKAKPSNGYRNLNFTGNTGDNITITWSDHPSANVTQFQIWRRVRHNGVTGSAVLLATVNHGTTSYTDYDYIYTSTYSDDLLYYDVRAYFQPDGTYADEDYVSVFGRFAIDPSKQNQNASIGMLANELPKEFSLGAYPNPFNPTTVIRYSVPEAGVVTLKVYNILSQEVASLVNETKAAGTHAVNFNANNLPTGIYIARLQAGSKVISIKLQLVK